ncbi:MAG: DUF1440 domain-containing protein [Acidobacteriota bacterium]|nr:DUF1440 domain-containing protein [Acidobacteriota bacterium]
MNSQVWKGLGAGLIGGLIASFAMGPAHSLASKLAGGGESQGEDSTVKTASAISEGVAQHKLTPEQKKVAGPAVHFGFGGAVGAAYGVAAELLPEVTTGYGIPFGTAVWLGAHVVMVPALGLSKPVTESTIPNEATELVAHFIYGGVTELCRQWLRKSILK